MSTWWFAVLIAIVGLERLLELVVATRNGRWARARGGVEHAAGHYPVMVVMHTGLLLAALAEVLLLDRPFVPVLGWCAVILVVAAQALRWWCIRTLGPLWNTRVIVVPGVDLVRRGPYRWMSHPNYLAVVLEVAALPLVHSAWLTALVFSVANAAVLAVRIPAENRALASVSPPAGAAP